MSEAEEAVSAEACYRHKTEGAYKTFKPGDFMFKPVWTFIHNGPCECEGKTVIECAEPGDPG